MKFNLRASLAKNTLYWLLGAGCLVNLVAHLICYPHLPDIIPIHWNANGVVDGEGPKYMALLLAVLPAGMLVLFRFVPSMDPKAENYRKFQPIWRAFVTGMTVFMVAVSWLTEASVFGLLPEQGNLVGALVGGGMGLALIVMGNYMPRVKQNYTFGCKTPWALADEHNWNRTQRMGGITLVVMGVVCMLAGIIGGGFANFMFVILVVGLAWIYIYSFLVFKNILK